MTAHPQALAPASTLAVGQISSSPFSTAVGHARSATARREPALRIRPIPDRTPPSRRRSTGSGGWSAVATAPAQVGDDLARGECVPGADDESGGQGVLLRLTAPPRPERKPVPEEFFGPRPTPTAELPEARGWAATMAMSVLQITQGIRPAAQVGRFTSATVQEGLVRRQISARRARSAPLRPTRVRRVLVSHPRDGVVDAAVVLDDGRRVRAMSMRLVGLDGRWVVVELLIG